MNLRIFMNRFVIVGLLLFPTFVVAEQSRIEKNSKTEYLGVKNQDVKDTKIQDVKQEIKIPKSDVVNKIDVSDRKIVVDKIKFSDKQKKDEITAVRDEKVVTYRDVPTVVPFVDEVVNQYEDDIVDAVDEEWEEIYEDDTYGVTYTANKKKTAVATVNWKNKPVQQITTDKLDKQDISKNAIFVQAYSANRTCDIYKDKKRKYDVTKSWCDNLRQNEWNVKFDYGLVNGKSVCALNKGTFARMGSPMGTDGQYCWCKVMKYEGKNVESPRWVFGEDIGSADACSRFCAFGCATGVQLNTDLRRVMFGVK